MIRKHDTLLRNCTSCWYMLLIPDSWACVTPINSV